MIDMTDDFNENNEPQVSDEVEDNADVESEGDFENTADIDSAVEKILTEVESLSFSDENAKSAVEIERDELKDSLLRLKADFDNFKKRVAKQEIELVERANISLLEKLLPALDVYDLAIQHFEAGNPETNFQGLKKAFDMLIEVLGQNGLEKVDKVGESFNPEIHEAVSHVQAQEDNDEGVETVKEVYRAGYVLKGKVIRPATVIVQS